MATTLAVLNTSKKNCKTNGKTIGNMVCSQEKLTHLNETATRV
jgi:hypothetical protein